MSLNAKLQMSHDQPCVLEMFVCLNIIYSQIITEKDSD